MTAIKAGWATWAGLLDCRRLHSNQYGKKFAHETIMSSGTNYRLSISLVGNLIVGLLQMRLSPKL